MSGCSLFTCFLSLSFDYVALNLVLSISLYLDPIQAEGPKRRVIRFAIKLYVGQEHLHPKSDASLALSLGAVRAPDQECARTSAYKMSHVYPSFSSHSYACSISDTLLAPALEAIEYNKMDFDRDLGKTSQYRVPPTEDRENAWLELIPPQTSYVFAFMSLIIGHQKGHWLNV